MAMSVTAAPIHVLEPAEWRGFHEADFPGTSWRVVDDMLIAQPTASPVDLVSRERFADFALTFEWLVPEGGNTGVLYRISEDAEQSWQSGPEMQLVDDRRHPDGAEPLTSCGALYDLVGPDPRLSPAAGVFHTGRIVMRSFTLEHWIGGMRVLACDLESRGARNRIASSKFAGFPLFGTEREGHIVLQHHGPGAAFRRLQIEVLG